MKLHLKKSFRTGISLLLTGSLCLIWSNNLNTGAQKGIVRTLSAKTLGQYGMNAGGTIKFAQDGEYVVGPYGQGSVIEVSTGNSVSSDSPRLISANLFFAYGLLDKWDISLSMPFYYDVTGWEENRSGVGDLEIATKLAYPFESKKSFFSHSYYLKITFPTGSEDRGYFPRHAYYMENDNDNPGDHPFTANSVLFNPMLLWSLDFGKINKKVQMQLHANLGGIITPVKSSSAMVAAVGLEYSPIELLDIFVEVAGESRVMYYTETFSVRSFDNDALWITPGVRINTPVGFYTTIAADFGISERRAQHRATWTRGGYQYSTAAVPVFGAQLTLGWSGVAKEKDSDGDGIIDKKDKCPDQPEDKDGFEDKDGCPDLDNDKDGILDLKDKCPNDVATCDGCPILDTDKDGINDDIDECPNDAEDKDGFEDSDGCPETDNDKDGIFDAQDKCPDKAEDTDGFEDTDGCPDLDNDGDGILDEADKCPNRKGVTENNGCPKTKEIKRGRIILKGVKFQSGKTVLDPNSFTILDEVKETLVEWPEIKLEIRGFTDSRGSYELNKKLSQKRAEAVMMYLINKGISSERLKAIGLGEENPVADNNTASGRAQNRRVEMHRVD